MGLELLYRDDTREHEQRGNRPVGHERDKDRDQAAHERTDDGDERAEEDECSNREGEGDAEQDGDEGDPGSVNEGDKKGGPSERGQLTPRDGARGRDSLARVTREQADDPGPDAVAFVEEEEQGKQRDERPRDDVRCAEPGLGQGAAEPFAGGDRGPGFVEVGRDLAVGDLERVTYPGADLLNALPHLTSHLREAARDLAADEEEQ